MHQYYRNLDTIGYINPEQGEYGTFYFMDAESMQVSERSILNLQDLETIQSQPVDRVKVLPLAEYLQMKIDSQYTPFLDKAFHSDYSFETDVALKNTIKEAILDNTFLTEFGTSTYFTSSDFEKTLQKYSDKLRKE